MTKFWKKWTINCAIGELVGIACAGSIAFFISPTIGEPKNMGAKLAVLGAMMFAGFIECAYMQSVSNNYDSYTKM